MTDERNNFWDSQIIPGKCIAGFFLNESFYVDTINKLSKQNLFYTENDNYIDIFIEKNDLVMSLFFGKKTLIRATVYNSKIMQYRGKIYNQVGLGDKINDLRKFGTIQREITGEEFFLFDNEGRCGLTVANGLDISLEEDSEQTIAMLSIHNFF